MPFPELTDAELAESRKLLLRFARIQLRDPAQAEDIVQETLAAAWGKLGQFREEADLKTWVTAILKNKIADHFRSGRRTAVSLDSLREENEAADQAWHTCFDAGGHWLETAAPPPGGRRKTMPNSRIFSVRWKTASAACRKTRPASSTCAKSWAWK